MARRWATVSNHARGCSGMPSRGQLSSATSSASWTTSRATSNSPRRRSSAPPSRPASSRNTAVSAASISSLGIGGSGPLWSSAIGVLLLHQWPDLDHGVARCVCSSPRLGELQRLIKVGHLDLSHPTNHFRSLKERTIGHEQLAIRARMNTSDGMGQMESITLSDLGAMLGHPLTGLGTLLGASLLRERLPCCQLFLICTKQKKVFHRLFLSVLEIALQRMRSNAPLYITTKRHDPKRTFLRRRWT